MQCVCHISGVQGEGRAWYCLCSQPLSSFQNSPHLNGTGPLKEAPSSSMSSPNGNSSISRPGPVSASTSVQNWPVSRSSVLPEHPKKQKITISIHNKSPARPGQPQSSLLGNPLEAPNKPTPSSTIPSPSAAQSTSSATASRATKPPGPTEPCPRPVVNGQSRLHASVLVPYGAESSEESDEEAKGLGRENGLGVGASLGAEASEACRLELRDTVTLNGVTRPDSDPRERGLSLDGPSCQAQPALHSESPFSKANGLPGKVRSIGGWLCMY